MQVEQPQEQEEQDVAEEGAAGAGPVEMEWEGGWASVPLVVNQVRGQAGAACLGVACPCSLLYTASPAASSVLQPMTQPSYILKLNPPLLLRASPLLCS